MLAIWANQSPCIQTGASPDLNWWNRRTGCNDTSSILLAHQFDCSNSSTTPRGKVGFNWSPNFTRQIQKPFPTITDSIADLVQVLLWNSIDSVESVTSSIFTSGWKHRRARGRRNVGIEEKCCQRPPGSKAGCQYNQWLLTTHWQQSAPHLGHKGSFTATSLSKMATAESHHPQQGGPAWAC